MIHSGGLFLSPDGNYVDHVTQPLSEVLAAPHYFGLTRDLAQHRFGTWIGSLFAYQPRGGTDEDLSDELGISISAVKKTWSSIYGRLSAARALKVRFKVTSSSVTQWPACH